MCMVLYVCVYGSVRVVYMCVCVCWCLSLGFSSPCQQVWEASLLCSLGQCSLRAGRSQHSLDLSLPSLYPSTF